MRMSAKNQSKAEQNTKIIRQLSQLAHNKNCFDCGQKGPTYVDDTIGAFVCTGCSGILRGLNPPHRIKSISMGTFSDDEVKFLQLRGNAFCRKAWLWNYDAQIGPRPPEVRDDQKMKDFLSLKYEKKRWYHAPHDTQIADQLKLQQEDAASLASSKNSVGSESSLSRRTSTNSQRSFRNDTNSTNVHANGTNQVPNSTGNNISLPRSHTSGSVSQVPAEKASGLAAAEDLFSVFGGLTVSSPATASSNSGGGVSQQDWASFSRSPRTPSLTPPKVPAIPSPKNHNKDGNQNFQKAVEKSPFGTTEPQNLLQPTTKAGLDKSKPFSSSKPIAAICNSDKYAALAELDEILNGASPAHKPILPDPQTFLATSPQGHGRGLLPQNHWAAAPPVGPFDSSNVWAQMPVFAAPTNPFLAAATAPPAATEAARQTPKSYNTNPFL